MPGMHTHCAELESLWRQGIPLTTAMGLTVGRFAGDELEVRAPLAPNVNVHGTAFAGSLYAICALTGWGALWLRLRARALDAEIVLAAGSIRYRKAVAEDIVCRCRFDAALQEPNLRELGDTGSAAFKLACTVDAGARRAVSFEGEYAAKLR